MGLKDESLDQHPHTQPACTCQTHLMMSERLLRVRIYHVLYLLNQFVFGIENHFIFTYYYISYSPIKRIANYCAVSATNSLSVENTTVEADGKISQLRMWVCCVP